MDKRYFTSKLVEWYQQNSRNLPWRTTNDPYKIWLSEIILQQTRVSQGLPYYERFISAFPNIRLLADASEQEVLRLWQGLGYYTRARNLHRCAKQIVAEHRSKFPSTFEELRSLPGIGDYTAAAVASFSFSERVAVLDGNVYRVLSRLFGIDTAINTPAAKRQFFTLANELISHTDPATHNQAMMEFGARQCVPVNPDCNSCVFKSQCVANMQSLVAHLPVKKKAKQASRRYFNYIVVRKGNSILMKKRTEKDIWLGLYDFPLIEKKGSRVKRADLKSALRQKSVSAIDPTRVEISDTYKHVLSHQTIYCRFLMIAHDQIRNFSVPDAKFYSKKRVHDLPKPVLISRFLNDHFFHC